MTTILFGLTVATVAHIVLSYLLNLRRSRQVAEMLTSYNAFAQTRPPAPSVLIHWAEYRDILTAAEVPTSVVKLGPDQELTVLELFGTKLSNGNGHFVTEGQGSIDTAVMRSLTQAESVFKRRQKPLEFLSFWSKSFHQELAGILGVASVAATIYSALQGTP